MFRDYDYIKTSDDIIFIVRGDQHPKDKIRAIPVYFPDKEGDRIDPITGKKFVKKVEEYSRETISKLHPEYLPSPNELNKYGVLVPIEDIVTGYNPQTRIRKCWEEGIFKNTRWGKLISSINKIAQISIKDMGVYGSFLVGLHKELSDVDLVIYGKENLNKLKENFELILKDSGFRKVNKKQLFAKSRKWSKYCPLSADQIFKILLRQWSRISFNEKKTTCVRFVYKEREIPSDPYTIPVTKSVKVKGRVIDSFSSHFFPRVIKIKSNDRAIEVITYYWLFFSCVKDGDKVKALGNYRKNSQREFITLDEPSHYIIPE